jgi:hypothetical protein
MCHTIRTRWVRLAAVHLNVLPDFFPLLGAILVAASVYWLRERYYRRTRVNPQRPDLTMAEAWEIWCASETLDPSAEALEQARESLFETERELVAAADLRGLRREIVRSATTGLYLETILEVGETERAALLKGYEPGMEPLLRNVIAVSTVRRQVLREYAQLKYDDAVSEDWFEQYIQVAGPYIREKVRLAREFLVELNQGAERLVEIYDELLRELEKNLLESPPKKRYPPPDLLPKTPGPAGSVRGTSL